MGIERAVELDNPGTIADYGNRAAHDPVREPRLRGLVRPSGRLRRDFLSL